MSDLSYSVHVISGLPRSGSTLLAALLRQNPQIIAASHNTPVMPMLIRIMSLMSEGEYRTEFKNGQWQRLMRGILQSYLNPDAQKHVMLDINREWCAHAGLLGHLYPKAKIICCVRDPVWILNSFEHLIIRDPLLGSRLVPITHRGTQHDRIDYLASREGAFGYAWRLLTEVFFGPFSDKVIIIDYDKLVREPVFVMERLTQLLNIQPFAYNFEYIETPDVDAFDAALGTPGLHYLRQSVAASRKRLILPPHIVERMAHQMFWRKPDLNSGGAVVIA